LIIATIGRTTIEEENRRKGLTAIKVEEEAHQVAVVVTQAVLPVQIATQVQDVLIVTEQDLSDPDQEGGHLTILTITITEEMIIEVQEDMIDTIHQGINFEVIGNDIQGERVMR
jgi:hypothetical protein